MDKKQGTFRNSLFFLLGILIFSFLFWLAEKNYAHVFGSILVVLLCYLLYKNKHSHSSLKERITTNDVTYICIGVIFDSFSGGFPFNILPPF
jgi:uncharacterized membrane protein YfcA